MPAPVDILLSQQQQHHHQKKQEQLLLRSHASWSRDPLLDYYEFTPSMVDAHDSPSDDDFYPHDLEANFCRDFSCCGLLLRDLHDLLQHYEECHVRFEEDDSTGLGYPAAPNMLDDWAASASDESRPSSPQPSAQDLLASLPLSAGSFKRSSLSVAAAAAAVSGVNLNDVLSQSRCAADVADELSLPLPGMQKGRKRAANGNEFASSALPSAKRLAAAAQALPPPPQQTTFVDDELLLAALLQINSGSMAGAEDMLHDSLLLQQQLLLSGRNTSLTAAPEVPAVTSTSQASTTAPTDGPSKPLALSKSAALPPLSAKPSAGPTTATATATVIVPPASLTAAMPMRTPSVERPYRCAVPGCEKSYKNANGLKYHNQHGHCNGTAAPKPSPVSAATNANGGAGHAANGLSSAAQRNASSPNGAATAPGDGAATANSPTKADRGTQIKPYRCTLLECGKSYKNLNGLKYHVEHAHPGAVALPLGKKAHVKAAASVIAQAQERLKMPTIKAVVVPASLVASMNVTPITGMSSLPASLMPTPMLDDERMVMSPGAFDAATIADSLMAQQQLHQHEELVDVLALH